MSTSNRINLSTERRVPGQAGSESERLANIWLLKVRKVGEQLLHRAPGRHGLDDHPNGNTHAPYAWLSAHHFRIDWDTQLLHAFMVANRLPHLHVEALSHRLQTAGPPRSDAVVFNI